MRATVEAGARLHFGFVNLSSEYDRLFGSLGVGLSAPRVVVTAEPAATVVCRHDLAAEYAERAVSMLGVDGASVTVESALPRHAGLGSGTQLALATLTAIAGAHGKDVDVRARAPSIGRGRRSGIGVATFEGGGFILDAGQPTDRFVEGSPPHGEWTVPDVVTRRELPRDWRFVLVLPNARPGKHGEDETSCIQSVIGDADPTVSEEIAAIVTERLLPALSTRQIDAFGSGMATIDALNGSWFAPDRDDVYRHPVATLVDELAESDALFGAGQSSWGPAVYGLTSVERAADARAAGERALASAGIDGQISVVAPRNEGAEITLDNKQM